MQTIAEIAKAARIAMPCSSAWTGEKTCHVAWFLAEKRLRALLRRAVDEKLLYEKHGDRKTLLYFPVEED
jgi:hypothetical protein